MIYVNPTAMLWQIEPGLETNIWCILVTWSFCIPPVTELNTQVRFPFFILMWLIEAMLSWKQNLTWGSNKVIEVHKSQINSRDLVAGSYADELSSLLCIYQWPILGTRMQSWIRHGLCPPTKVVWKCGLRVLVAKVNKEVWVIRS